MSDLLTLPTENPKSTGDDDDELDHLFCWCNEFVALCGTDLSDTPLIEDGP